MIAWDVELAVGAATGTGWCKFMRDGERSGIQENADSAWSGVLNSGRQP